MFHVSFQGCVSSREDWDLAIKHTCRILFGYYCYHRYVTNDRENRGIYDRNIWEWVKTYRYIFSGMNIHLPAILGFTRYQGFDPSPYRNYLICAMVKF